MKHIPATRESQYVGITQPRDHYFADLCTEICRHGSPTLKPSACLITVRRGIQKQNLLFPVVLICKTPPTIVITMLHFCAQ